MPRNQSSLLRTLHAYSGKTLLRDLQNQEGTTLKSAMVRFRGLPGSLQEDMIQGPLWRETFGRNLGSHDVAELVEGMFLVDGWRYETARLYATLYKTTTGWDSFNYNRVLRQTLVRSSARTKSKLLLKTYSSSERELADKTSD